MTDLRVVSLLPSATEIAVALGLGDALVGRSHECDFPAPVAALPAVTSTKLEKGLRSAEIHGRVTEIVAQGLSVYRVDAELLRDLAPDVVLTQMQCAVCAVTPADLADGLASWVGTAPELVSLAPDALADVWETFRLVGRATGRERRAEAAVAELAGRLDALRDRAAGGERPRVAAIEWFDPLMAAGNWVPELVEAAGGEPLFAAAGQHSPFLEWEALAAADPDVVVLMPCGYQIPQSLADVAAVADRPRWRNLRAVRQGRVFVADGHHYFNRPGPRLVESAEILAEVLAAGRGGRDEGRGWRRFRG